jgi:predicted GIY-YIG superfamily endonuclease
MSFWTYMLHCNGGHFYVGHTDDLERRLAQHQSGILGGYTYSRRPVRLVWSERFQNRDDAKAMEHRIKGWSRAKKLALIREDWNLISALATSSGAEEKTVLRQAQDGGKSEGVDREFTNHPNPTTPSLPKGSPDLHKNDMSAHMEGAITGKRSALQQAQDGGL